MLACGLSKTGNSNTNGQILESLLVEVKHATEMTAAATAAATAAWVAPAEVPTAGACALESAVKYTRCLHDCRGFFPTKIPQQVATLSSVAAVLGRSSGAAMLASRKESTVKIKAMLNSHLSAS